MDPFLGWAPELGPLGLLVATVTAVLTGRLWPLRTVRAVLDPMRDQLTEYRAALATERERGDILHRQLAEAQEVARMAAKAMQALQDMASERHPPVTARGYGRASVPWTDP